MSTQVLWRRLTRTDFNAMHGQASPYGRGGGAMHIALGVRTDEFPIDLFLNAPGKKEVTIAASAGPENGGREALTISSNPHRRGGEWLVRDQFSHRHPAWSEAAGFPTVYQDDKPICILLFRVGQSFHARFLGSAQMRKLNKEAIPREFFSKPKGITSALPAMLAAFNVPSQTPIDLFDEFAADYQSAVFDPSSVIDGRQRIVAAILLRQGQSAFRHKLLNAYGNRCAVTRCSTPWVLEAAHISPYRGIKTNAISNGLLLRADIHTLFDLGLISVKPSDLRIRVAKALRRSSYSRFDGHELLIPTNKAYRPSLAALTQHYALFEQ